jgi:CRP/FNR family transcriptional regulator, dissimilatory nitrate respiration regulator
VAFSGNRLTIVKHSVDRGGAYTGAEVAPEAIAPPRTVPRGTMGAMTRVDMAGMLRRTPLFGALSPALFQEIVSLCGVRTVRRRELIFSDGDPAAFLPVLLAGRVKLLRAGPDGREQVLHVVRAPAAFAEAAVFGPGVFPATAEVLEDGQLATLPRPELLDLMRRRPEVALALLASMSMWLRRLVALVDGLSLHTVEDRVAAYLWSLFVRSGRPLLAGLEVHLDDPKHLIAALCGTAPEVLSRTFRKLEAAGAVRVAGPVASLLDPARLRSLSHSGEGE